MSEDSQLDFVRGWVVQSGYALELRIAAAMEAAGGEVTQSPLYTDPVEEKQREADVVHTRFLRMDRRFVVQLITVIECKSSKKSPWVVFDTPHVQSNRRSALDKVYVRTPDSAVRELVDSRLSADDLFDYEWYGNSVVAAKRGDEDSESINPANRAVRQVVSATVGISRQFTTSASDTVALPVVVTEAPLFTCRLHKGSGEILVEPAEYAQIRTMTPTHPRPIMVHVMTEKFAVSNLAEITKRLALRLGDPA